MFEFPAEHPQHEHVEENVHRVAVQEAVIDELPGHEIAIGRADRPQCKRVNQSLKSLELLQGEHEAVRHQQDEDDVGYAAMPTRTQVVDRGIH